MRLGGPTFSKIDDPEQWLAALQAKGYRASFCPLSVEADEAAIHRFAQAAERADIVIAEVGAWSNPLSPDDATRRSALDLCKRSLHLADRIGARCCVNIAGSRGTQWDGPHPANLTPDTFERIVECVREIIDEVKPTRTCYTLETMPWMYPDSPDSYLALIAAIDRRAFAVHLDPVNLVSSPQLYFNNGALIRECIEKLGPWIKSCHAKDIRLGNRMTTHLDEVRPGLGDLDYPTFLREVARLPQDVPVMLEHLESEDEYDLAAQYVRSIADSAGISV